MTPLPGPTLPLSFRSRWSPLLGLLLLLTSTPFQAWADRSQLPAFRPPGQELQREREQESISTGLFLANQRPPYGYLRGDHEVGNLLLLVWQPEWESAVKHLAAAAAKEMEVQILVPRGAWHASRKLRRWARRHCVDVSFQRYDTAWIRDYGPLQFVHRGQVTWGDFSYDPARPEDDALPLQLAEDFHMPIALRSERLDGGGLVSNGHGLCVMTDATLTESLAESGQHQTTAALASALGCRALAVIGALPDEQTGHADVSVQFLDDNLVAISYMDPHQAPVHALLLDQAAMIIQDAAERLGQPLKVIRVPMAHHNDVFYSYINMVRSQHTVFVPSYKGVPIEMEREAHRVLARGLPNLRFVPVASDAIVEYGGALHCITLGLSVPTYRQQSSATCRRAKAARKRHTPRSPKNRRSSSRALRKRHKA